MFQPVGFFKDLLFVPPSTASCCGSSAIFWINWPDVTRERTWKRDPEIRNSSIFVNSRVFVTARVDWNGNYCYEWQRLLQKWQRLFQMATTVYERENCIGGRRERRWGEVHVHPPPPPEKMFCSETSNRGKKVPPRYVGKRECTFRSDATKLKRKRYKERDKRK